MRATQGLQIVHATERFVVVDKPAGLLSVPGKGPEKADCVAARVRKAFPEATGPLVVHRLDMDTSGLLVLGLDEDAQRELSRQFEAREVEKRYTALVDGVIDWGAAGEIDLPMRADIENRPVQVLDFEHGRLAVTRWRVLGIEVDRTLLELEPLTGRSHQLRVHCALARVLAPWDGSRAGARGGLGAPIVGDVLYGVREWWRPGSCEAASRAGAAGGGAARLMLHASSLAFTDPGSGRRAEFRSEAGWKGGPAA